MDIERYSKDVAILQFTKSNMSGGRCSGLRKFPIYTPAAVMDVNFFYLKICTTVIRSLCMLHSVLFIWLHRMLILIAS